jgi:hypothetical protein
LFQDVPNPFVATETADFRRKAVLQHFVRGKVEIAFLPPGSVFSSLNGFPINIKKSAEEPGDACSFCLKKKKSE